MSTARDMSKIAIAIWRDFPEYRPWFALRELTHNGIRQYNHNALLWRDPSVNGIKTGHTRNAGFCLIASAQRGEMHLIAVVLGAADENARVAAGQQLIDYGFRNFETRRLYAARAELTRVRVWMGDIADLPLGPDQAVYVTLPRGFHDRIHASMTVKQSRMAPVRAGEPIGKLTLELDRDPIAEYPLVALRDVARGSIFQRLYDQLRQLLH
jgi:D-alanyl-D-alanine carboxypeptidase (penicillin-binding protein 5/6)